MTGQALSPVKAQRGYSFFVPWPLSIQLLWRLIAMSDERRGGDLSGNHYLGMIRKLLSCPYGIQAILLPAPPLKCDFKVLHATLFVTSIKRDYSEQKGSLDASLLHLINIIRVPPNSVQPFRGVAIVTNARIDISTSGRPVWTLQQTPRSRFYQGFTI